MINNVIALYGCLSLNASRDMELRLAYSYTKRQNQLSLRNFVIDIM